MSFSLSAFSPKKEKVVFKSPVHSFYGKSGADTGFL